MRWRLRISAPERERGIHAGAERCRLGDGVDALELEDKFR
jgi:hypothetical protein